MAVRTPRSPRSRKQAVTTAPVVAPIRSHSDIISARARARELADILGFSPGDQASITTVISELGRNIVRFADRGEIQILPIRGGPLTGIGVVAHDNGPGIENVDYALTDGFSTSGGLGLGLPGVRRLTDGFDIESHAGVGTTVRIEKWLNAEPQSHERAW